MKIRKSPTGPRRHYFSTYKGMKNGREVVCDMDNKIMREFFWEENNKIQEINYHKNGNTESILTFYNNLNHGYNYFYDERGNLYRLECWENGRKISQQELKNNKTTTFIDYIDKFGIEYVNGKIVKRYRFHDNEFEVY